MLVRSEQLILMIGVDPDCSQLFHSDRVGKLSIPAMVLTEREISRCGCSEKLTGDRVRTDPTFSWLVSSHRVMNTRNDTLRAG
jgi:hypothetical protein